MASFVVLVVTGFILVLSVNMNSMSASNKKCVAPSFLNTLKEYRTEGKIKRKYMITRQRDGSSALQCLDFCLRTDDCASFDVKTFTRNNDQRRFCRIYDCNLASIPARDFITEKERDAIWHHYDIGSTELRKVRSLTSHSNHFFE